jgi:hypothetical protein
VVESIRHYSQEDGTWKTVSWFLGQPAGEDFPIKPGVAYLIYMKEDAGVVQFEGIAVGAEMDLGVGLNLACLPAQRDVFTYTNYEMLGDLGSEEEVSSVRRYHAVEGWQSTSWFLGLPFGVEYDMRAGQGYLIYMKQEKPNWRPY